MHNCHIWGLKRPHEIYRHMRRFPDVNVRCVTMHGHFIKPPLLFLPFLFMEHYYGKHLPGYVMKVCLFTDLLNSTRRWNFVSTRRDPPHYRYEILNALNVRFSNKWIGWGGLAPYLPWSSDLSSLVLFLCVFTKILVYSLKIRNLRHLRDRITTTVPTITTIFLRGIWKKLGII